jgi:hypothetical protein
VLDEGILGLEISFNHFKKLGIPLIGGEVFFPAFFGSLWCSFILYFLKSEQFIDMAVKNVF